MTLLDNRAVCARGCTSITSASASVLHRSRPLLGGAFALVLRVALVSPHSTLIDADTYNQLFTHHGVVMVFLFMIPAIPAAFGNFLLPLMIGARDVAFPRAQPRELLHLRRRRDHHARRARRSAASTPAGRSTRRTAPTTPTAVTLAVLGVFIVGVSSILTGLNFIVTVHTMRAPGRDVDAAAALRVGDLRDLHHPGARDAGARPRAAARRHRSRVAPRPVRSARPAAIRCCSSTCSGSTRTRPSTS